MIARGTWPRIEAALAAAFEDEQGAMPDFKRRLREWMQPGDLTRLVAVATIALADADTIRISSVHDKEC
ncbi:hypothetical protein [uncultured Halomonas sp.]|uniref:hypothetical protein n=1 Tax=uncultured Halomonas sp. TaxID=173971 RepID=UPI00260233F0|nr:hypothetical protein [uncultured Halomonas sp.]